MPTAYRAAAIARFNNRPTDGWLVDWGQLSAAFDSAAPRAGRQSLNGWEPFDKRNDLFATPFSAIGASARFFGLS